VLVSFLADTPVARFEPAEQRHFMLRDDRTPLLYEWTDLVRDESLHAAGRGGIRGSAFRGALRRGLESIQKISRLSLRGDGRLRECVDHLARHLRKTCLCRPRPAAFCARELRLPVGRDEICLTQTAASWKFYVNIVELGPGI